MKTLRATYAKDVLEGDVLNSNQQVRSVEVGDRWVWITTTSGDTVVHPVWRVINVRR